MAITDLPYIPTNITVHLGAPSSPAGNITVPFPEYIKNVASSEIYPTWPEEALRANILAQISFALNRVYTEFYRSRGYAFDITSTTQMDQKFIPNRNIFQNISLLVDEIFTNYIHRIGFIEPLLAQFCNGTTTTCAGLSQWGSEALAQNGSSYWEILQHYYGTNIDLVRDAPIQDISSSTPPSPLRLGDIGEHVYYLQVMLNRVGRAYPLIPRINPETGVFNASTEAAVRTFQSVFNLAVDGIVGRATWNKLLSLYTGIVKMTELISEGLPYLNYQFGDPRYIVFGTESRDVAVLQYVLRVLAQFTPTIDSELPITGVFDAATQAAVKEFQESQRLAATGLIDTTTWDRMLGQYAGFWQTVLSNQNLFPLEQVAQGTLTLEELQNIFQQQISYPGTPLAVGNQDEQGGAF